MGVRVRGKGQFSSCASSTRLILTLTLTPTLILTLTLTLTLALTLALTLTLTLTLASLRALRGGLAVRGRDGGLQAPRAKARELA